MKNQDLIKLNELNQNSNGGTELTTRDIFDGLPREILESVNIISSRVREISSEKPNILHLHDLPGDPENDHLHNVELVKRFETIVYSSHWQMQQFQQTYDPLKTFKHQFVVNTGVKPFNKILKNDKKIKLIYTSTPHRGLEILVHCFKSLYLSFPDIELDVFSSFEIYGWKERDVQYKELFETCQNHPAINYYGFRSNEEVRQAVSEAHIFAYPCIWPETSCRSLIEAMMARCICIHPNFGALIDTSGGLTIQYPFNYNTHANVELFTLSLYNVLANRHVFFDEEYQATLDLIQKYAEEKFSLEKSILIWKNIIQSTHERHR